MSPLMTLVVAVTCVFPSLIYNYQVYKAKKANRLQFVLINLMAVLIVFTLYLATITLKQ